MASTPAGRQLTAQHRQAQLQVRAAALRDFLAVWPVWDGDDDSFGRMVAATVPLVVAYHGLAARLAAAYYQAFRLAERPGGAVTPSLADLDPGVVAGTLYVTGRDMTRRAVAAGQQPAEARRAALVRTTGTVGRLALAGGRDTLTRTVAADPRARGHRRVLSPGACDHCRSLAAEPLTGDFSAHDHCGCAAEPVFL